MYTQSVGYPSPYAPMSRHLGSYNLGVSPAHRLGSPFDLAPLGNQQMAYSRVAEGNPALSAGINSQGSVLTAQQRSSQQQYAPYGQSVQSQYINSPQGSGLYNPSSINYNGQSGAQQQGSINPSLSPVQQQQYQQQQQQNIQQQQGGLQQQGFNSSSPVNVVPSGVAVSSTGGFISGKQGNSGAYQNYANDHADRDYNEQDLAQTRRLNPNKIVGPAIYSYDDIDGDQRIRKPLDQEQEQKLSKLKSEKTKRELHVQELDYKIHILEQENQSLRNQMEQMKNDYKRLNQVYEEKYSHEIDRLHLENQDYENSNKQWATRFKDLEAKCDDLVQDKQDLEEENRKLNDKILKIQVLLHEQPIKNQMRFDNSSKNF